MLIIIFYLVKWHINCSLYIQTYTYRHRELYWFIHSYRFMLYRLIYGIMLLISQRGLGKDYLDSPRQVRWHFLNLVWRSRMLIWIYFRNASMKYVENDLAKWVSILNFVHILHWVRHVLYHIIHFSSSPYPTNSPTPM